MDGMTFLRALRDEPDYGSKARVVVLSNLADKDKVDETISLGVMDYIIKSNWGIKEIADKIKLLVTI